MKPSLGIVIITVLWIIAILIISPFGEFPLNDDWAYAKSVQHLHNTGKMKMDGWPAMTLVAQIAWGGLFCKIGGFSFLTLRISTLVTGLIGLFAFYELARQLAKDKNLALFATLLLGFNPMFLSLSFTFMTDVHFFSFSMLSCLFFLKNLQTDKWLYFWIGIFCSLLATLIRQPGILFPIAYAICYFYKNRTIKDFIKAGFPFLCALVALILHGMWLKSTQAPGGNVIGISKTLGLFKRLLDWQHVLTVTSCIFLYVGTFLLPLSILYGQKIKNCILQYKLSFLVVFAVSAGLLYEVVGYYPMGSGHIMQNIGVAPKTLKDAWFYVNVSPNLPRAVWLGGTKSLGLIGAFALLMVVFFPPKLTQTQQAENKQPSFVTETRAYLWLVMLMYGVLLVVNLVFFDRHLIPLIAFLILVILPEKVEYNFFQKGLGVASLLFMAWFSVSATHDYLAWNRARWEGLNELTEVQKISPARIDGGFEFNGWHQPGQSDYIENRTLQHKSWWWVADDEYLLTFGKMDGYEPVKAYPYFQTLIFRTDTVYVLKRK